MTLETIRTAKNLDDLKPAIAYLSDHMQKMTFGDFIAYRRTIEQAAKSLGISFEIINKMADEYQTTGEI